MTPRQAVAHLRSTETLTVIDHYAVHEGKTHWIDVDGISYDWDSRVIIQKDKITKKKTTCIAKKLIQRYYVAGTVGLAHGGLQRVTKQITWRELLRVLREGTEIKALSCRNYIE